MQKNKKIILGILLLIFFLIVVIAVVLGNKTGNNENPNTGIETEEKDRMELVDDYEEFFSVQATINDIDNVEMDSSYVAKEIYIHSISKTRYYFIRCIKMSEFDDSTDVYLLLIVDGKNNSYELEEIKEHIDDLQKYAADYNVVIKNINSSNILLSGSSEPKNVLTSYLEFFKKLLIKDSYAAYNMLHTDTKSKYIDYNDFDANVVNIYQKLSSGIFSYSVKDSNDSEIKTYYFEDDNRNKIVIYEESIMNFKISF
ncbi:MAG: hypothetical protein IJN03_00275 [Bacilli bacterium]|nr:hypothetical protein [Bacilli bacterium]